MVKYTSAAPARLSTAKKTKFEARPNASTTAAETSRPIKLLATLPVNVGRECAAGIRRTALLAEIGQCQRKGGSHAQSLHDAKDGENREIGRDRKQDRWNREDRETEQNAAAAVDVLAEKAHDEPGNRHPHRAGIDGEAHCRRRYIVVPGKRR
jgi:hypothetical protein